MRWPGEMRTEKALVNMVKSAWKPVQEKRGDAGGGLWQLCVYEKMPVLGERGAADRRQRKEGWAFVTQASVTFLREISAHAGRMRSSCPVFCCLDA